MNEALHHPGEQLRMAERQLNGEGHYQLHHPSPAYIFPFLLARERKIDKALAILDNLHVNHLRGYAHLRPRIRKLLVELAEDPAS